MAFRTQDNREIRSSGGSEMILFPRRLYECMISGDLEVIWELLADFVHRRIQAILMQLTWNSEA